jgi:hypothetical protein
MGIAELEPCHLDIRINGDLVFIEYSPIPPYSSLKILYHNKEV